MSRLEELRASVSSLSASEKAKLAADLLESLPPVLDDKDGGIAEALRRDEEMDRDPSTVVTWDEIRRGLGR